MISEFLNLVAGLWDGFTSKSEAELRHEEYQAAIDVILEKTNKPIVKLKSEDRATAALIQLSDALKNLADVLAIDRKHFKIDDSADKELMQQSGYLGCVVCFNQECSCRF